MDLLSHLRSARLLAIVRGTDAQAALTATQALLEEGIELVEISLTTPQAIEVIAAAARDLPAGAAIGCGTVLQADDVDRATGAGASFVVSPALGPAVEHAVERAIPILAGAFTPTEIRAAHASGASAIKLFPASLGGPGYLRALRDPFPDVPLVPVGGVDEHAARDYLRAGASAAGVGSPLVGDAASGGSLSALRERARRFRDALAALDD